jgi:putative hemolysin
MNILYVILFVICLALSAFFCSAETAFIGMQKLRLQHLLQTGNSSAKIVAKIMEQPERFLATVLLGINFFETALATLGTIITVDLLNNKNLGAAIATIVITLITLVVAEFLPKSIGARYGEKIALAYARPINIISIIFFPVVYVLNHLGLRFTKLFGESTESKLTISQEEFHTMISVGHKEGTVEDEAAEMLHNIFDFGDQTVGEVMLPRTEVIFVEYGSKLGDFLSLYAQHPLSRYPVFQERRDNVVGILEIKDVLIALSNGTLNNDSAIDRLVRPAFFTPESKPLDELFTEMRNNNHHIAVVVDEFGGTAGIISLSGLLEEIVGFIGDEFSDAEKEFEIIDEYTFQIDGGMRIEEANEEMGLELPESENYETVAGFILSLLGRIPKTGEHLRYKDMNLTITEMRGLKIEKILLAKPKKKIEDATPSG